MSLFTEDQFLCLDSRYLAQVSAGYLLAAKRTAAILGLARDLGDVLPLTIKRIQRLGRMFRDYRVGVFENDSTDGTGIKLQAWADEDPRVQLFTSQLGAPRLCGRNLDRAAALGRYRSRLQRWWLDLPTRTDYVIVLDLDLRGGFSFDGVAHSLTLLADFVGANGLRPRKRGSGGSWVYHDVWAFRHKNHPQPHRPYEINPLSLPRGAAPLPVESCFGGIGIYAAEAYAAGKYSGADCEHVMFHRTMAAAGFAKRFMNPSLITVY